MLLPPGSALAFQNRRMSKSLPPATRRQIIAFDPAAPDAPSVSEFCRAVGISRPSFYNLRERYAAEGNGALNPRSRAPKTPARVFERDTVEAVLNRPGFRAAFFFVPSPGGGAVLQDSS